MSTIPNVGHVSNVPRTQRHVGNVPHDMGAAVAVRGCKRRLLPWLAALGAVVAGSIDPAGADGPDAERPWARHVIDSSSRGADGVRLADVDGDGRPDIVTGWEEGGVTRVYLHPGPDAARRPWPAVTVGRTPNVEDAVFADLDGDGRTDVVSSCEGRTRTMFVHWAPEQRRAYLDPAAWKTEPLAASQGAMMWMFCVPLELDGRHGLDLVAAGKGSGAAIGWFEAPQDPRRLDQWKWHPIGQAGWIMSLRAADVDGDGDPDVVATDRKGPMRGCRWLENPGPGPAQTGPWRNHFIGGRDHEVMFMTLADFDGDGTADVLCATRDDGLLWFCRRPGRPETWEPSDVPMPPGVGTGKGIGVGDVDRDGRADLVFTCENAKGDRCGVAWLGRRKSPGKEAWLPHPISGPEGIKFDRLELLDVDGDGDLDVLTCEESYPVEGRRRGLGVIWYENPGQSSPRPTGACPPRRGR